MKEYILKNEVEILEDISENVEECGSRYSDYKDTLKIIASRIVDEDKTEEYYSKLHAALLGLFNKREVKVNESELGLILEECPDFKYNDIVDRELALHDDMEEISR